MPALNDRVFNGTKRVGGIGRFKRARVRCSTGVKASWGKYRVIETAWYKNRDGVKVRRRVNKIVPEVFLRAKPCASVWHSARKIKRSRSRLGSVTWKVSRLKCIRILICTLTFQHFFEISTKPTIHHTFNRRPFHLPPRSKMVKYSH
jgi:hypothetical protein